MERSNTHSVEDELKNLTLDNEEEEIKNTFNHPFVMKCKQLKEDIESCNIDELRKYLQSDSMKMTIIRLHDYYKHNIEDIPNSSIVKKEIDGLLWYLDIQPERCIAE